MLARTFVTAILGCASIFCGVMAWTLSSALPAHPAPSSLSLHHGAGLHARLHQP